MFRSDDIFRILRALVSAELKAAGNLKTAEKAPSWTPETTMDDDGLGLDSLGLLNAAGAVNRFFCLHEAGVEDYLLAHRTFGNWVEIVQAGFAEGTSGLCLQTSGSTGIPKDVTVSWAAIRREAEALAKLYSRDAGPPQRIINHAPAHHMYGMLHSVALAATLDCEVVEAGPGYGFALRDLCDGDLFVSFPSMWRFVLATGSKISSGVTGVTSTGPMDAATAAKLISAGLDRLFEIYGSTETGGVGWRDAHGAPWQLFDWWQAGPGDCVTDRDTKAAVSLMDHIIWDSDDARRFTLGQRRDEAVQIGGTNVFPAYVASRIADCDAVTDCLVALSRAGDEPRLVATVIPANGLDADRVREAVTAFARDNLKPVERPQTIHVVPHFPSSETGKPVPLTSMEQIGS